MRQWRSYLGAIVVISLLATVTMLHFETPSRAFGATTITVNPVCSRLYNCSFSPTDYSIGVGESPTLSVASNADAFHNVTSAQKGLDGRPLFQSATVGAGQAALVDGTKYLAPGVYPFVCSIHAHPSTGGGRMTGTLVITDDGATPQVRPTIDLTFPAQSLAGVRNHGKITAVVESALGADNVILIAKLHDRRLGWTSGISLEPGVPRSVNIGLRGVGREALRGVKSASVSMQASVRFGIPDTVRRKLH